MKTQVKRLKDNLIELKVDVEAEKFGDAVKQAYKTIAEKISIPGFRKGKIPKKVIDNRIGKSAVYEEALRSNISQYYAEAAEKSKIEPISKPEVEITKADENGLSFIAKVQVEPEVKLGNFKDVKITKKEPKITDADVEKQLGLVKEKFASVEPVKGKEAQKGDYVLINFDGTINGKPFEGSSAKDFMLEIGSNAFVPQFEEALVGSKAGEIKDITITIPESNPNKEVAGKNARFRVLVKEVKIKKMPAIDDNFVKENLGDYETLKDLKKEIKVDLEEQAKKIAEDQYRAEVLDSLVDKSEVKLPDVIVKDEIDKLVKDFEYGLKIRGTDLQSYLKATKNDESSLRESFKQEAEKRVKRNLIIKAVANKENIGTTDIELNSELKKLYESQQAEQKAKQSYKDFKRDLDDRGLVDYLKSSIRYHKALDFLENQAQSNVRK